ncbi:MAG: hypothetical protein V9H69_08810 [Anaerolineae bacterium]
MSDYDDDAPVLVAVVNNARDFARARDEGWYRIPVQRAPRRVAAEYLAFYQTRAFGDDGCAVNYYAPVRRFHLLTRAELLPQEPDHPRGRRLLQDRDRPVAAAAAAGAQPRPAPHHLHRDDAQPPAGCAGDQRSVAKGRPTAAALAGAAGGRAAGGVPLPGQPAGR